jgi:septal ring-binding cell division protein DamX
MFDFYKILPNTSLKTLTAQNIAQDATKVTPGTTPAKPAPNLVYTLQIASVKDNNQATRLVKTINAIKKLGNNQARVVPSSRHGETWYSVRLGPFTKRIDAQRVQNILDRHYLSGMILSTAAKTAPTKQTTTLK